MGPHSVLTLPGRPRAVAGYVGQELATRLLLQPPRLQSGGHG